MAATTRVTPRQEIAAPTILFVPGVRDHVPEHWQTLLEHKLPKATSRAAHGTRQALLRGVGRNARPVARADRRARRAGRAQRRRHDRRALGATASSVRSRVRCSRHRPISNRRCLPVIRRWKRCSENGWLPTPRTRLPFPSIVAASTNDPLGRIDRVEALAARMGQSLRRRRRRRPSESGGGLWRVAAGRGTPP